MNGRPTARTLDDLLLEYKRDIIELKRRLPRSAGLNEGYYYGQSKVGYLEKTYRIGGPARVHVESLDAPLSDYLNWRVGYEPDRGRVVSLEWNGSAWEIAGQPEMAADGSGFWALTLDPAKWANYNAWTLDTQWNERIGATRLPTGLVVLSGLIRALVNLPANDVLTVLPPAFRPEYEVIASVMRSDLFYPISIKPNGEVSFRTGTTVSAGNYINLDGVVFWSADSDATGHWIDIGTGGTSWASGFGSTGAGNDANFGVPAVYQDRYGFVWGRGLARVNTAQSAGDNPMINLPVAMRAHKQQHYRAIANDVHALLGSRPGAGGIDWKPPTGGSVGSWINLSGFGICTPTALSGNPWQDAWQYVNGWNSYNEAQFPRMGWLRRGDGLMMMKGLIAAGGISSAFTNMGGYLEYTPRARTLILQTVSAEQYARINVRGDRYVGGSTPRDILPGQNVSNSWVAFDPVMYVP